MLIQGDSAAIPLPDNFIDAIVTDPPYGLSFMGKDWDHGVPGIRFWKEILRVAKPGAHLLAFGGTRTFHRLAVAIEDAGWEIRDTVGWIYGSGFPKSHSVSKAIDKAAGAERETIGEYQMPIDSDAGNAGKPTIDRGDGGAFTAGGNINITAPATEAAKQWDGWGTALKPAWEPIIVARKPFKGTVVANVLEHGTGAINIDDCRIGTEETTINTFDDGMKPFGEGAGHPYTSRKVQGRWPANIIHDGSDEVLEVFPSAPSAGSYTKSQNKPKIPKSLFGTIIGPRERGNEYAGESGSAARFFYCAKASRKERNAGLEGMEEKPLLWSSGTKNPGSFQSDGTHKATRNNHPTVKPIALMRYLCRLVTPPNGVVFDPFMGSGSTGVAAIQEGFEFIGCDIEAEYVEIAKRRINKVIADGIQIPFG